MQTTIAPLEIQTRAKVSCGAVAAIAVCLGFVWQCTTVTRNYGGDWTALFCIGEVTRLPPALLSAYRFKGSSGFDGQFYLVIALDPLLRHGFSEYVDEPGLRYRRILVPAMAFALAFGRPDYIPYTYILVTLIFLFLGVWSTAQYCSPAACSRFGDCCFC